jgi:hypothetical protein
MQVASMFGLVGEAWLRPLLSVLLVVEVTLLLTRNVEANGQCCVLVVLLIEALIFRC